MSARIRCVSVPAHRPLQPESWDEMGQVLRAAARASARAYNVAMEHLVLVDREQALDARSGGEMDRGGRPKVGRLGGDSQRGRWMYRAMCDAAVDDLASGCISQIAQLARKRLAGRNSVGRPVRLALRDHDQAIPSYTYPQPIHVRRQDWSLRWQGSEYVVSARITPGRGPRQELVLKNGREFMRQKRVLEKICGGELSRSTLTIRLKRGRAPMLSIAYDAGPPIERERTGTLHVRTTRECLIVATLDDRIWRWHGDHIERAIAEYQRRQQNLADDRKWEDRRRGKRGQGDDDVRRRQAAIADKHARRMDTWLHQITARIAGLADRQRVAAVELDTTDRSRLPKFPYYMMATRLETKLEDHGITMTNRAPDSLEAEGALT